MIEKIELKRKAIGLRKLGKTYSQILENVPVAKSTLSIWLKDVGLAKSQKQRITKARLEAGIRGGLAKKNSRIALVKAIQEESAREIGVLTKRELWLIGIALYWAEGSKEKEYRPGSGVEFTNSDPEMINIFLLWLLKCCSVANDKIHFQLYLHETKKNDVLKIRKFWSITTGLSLEQFKSVYWKKDKIKTKRRNVGDLYYGNLRVKVRTSSSLNRKISGWIKGINLYNCRLV